MEKTGLLEHALKRIIRETIKECEHKPFYVANSSFFDSHPYDIDTIAQAVKRAGGQRIRTEPSYGWANQPDIVVFDATEETAKEIASEVSRTLGTDWVHIRPKEW